MYDSPTPMCTSPATASLPTANSASVLSVSSRISSQRWSSSTPRSVSATLWLPRTNSFAPSSSFSSALRWRDRAGCVTNSTLAAWVMLPSRATAKK